MTIKKRLILTISLATTLIVTIFSVITLSLKYNEEYSRFDEKKIKYTEMLITLLSLPLWDLNIVAIDQIGQTVVADDDIVKIIVQGTGNTIKTELAQDNDGATEVIEKDVYYNGILVGKINIFFTRDKINKILLDQIYQFVFILIVLEFSLNGIVILSALSFTKPLYRMVEQLKGIGAGNLKYIEKVKAPEELVILSKAINDLKDEIKNREEHIKKFTIQAAEDSFKLELEKQRFQIEQTQRIESQRLQGELEQSLKNLHTTQDQLISAEKMAMLGSLVAGVAHEINTPLGIGVTAASFISEKVEKMSQDLKSEDVSYDNVSEWVTTLQEASELLFSNITRSAEIIRGFKQVSVDQTSEAMRLFYPYGYICEVVASLHPKIKKINPHVEVICEKNLRINSYPGALAQILTNMIINSLIHGLPDVVNGEIRIEVETKDSDTLKIKYSDNGKGLSPDELPHIFEPFRTTMRNEGGSGLGTYIIYNIVTQKLKGTIKAQSEPGRGLAYHIEYMPESISRSTDS